MCLSCCLYLNIIIATRAACAIEFPNALILTGGEKTRSKVSVYNMGNDSPGYMFDLPDLQVGRADHGCGYYINGDSEKVKHMVCLYVFYKNLALGFTCHWRLQFRWTWS